MPQVTIQRSDSGAYFTVQDSTDGILRPYMVNGYDFVPSQDGESFSLEAASSKSVDRFKIIDNAHFSSIINGDTGDPFADFDSLRTYILTNFFRNPNGASGGGAVITDNGISGTGTNVDPVILGGPNTLNQDTTITQSDHLFLLTADDGAGFTSYMQHVASGISLFIAQQTRAGGAISQIQSDGTVAYLTASDTVNSQAIQVDNSGGNGVVVTDDIDSIGLRGTKVFAKNSDDQYVQYGNLLIESTPKLHIIFIPLTGDTIDVQSNKYNIINPAAPLAALTLNMPTAPINNDCVYIKFTQAITAVTYSNGTIVGGVSSPTAAQLEMLVYDSDSDSWY
jgi:hypothetical protein